MSEVAAQPTRHARSEGTDPSPAGPPRSGGALRRCGLLALLVLVTGGAFVAGLDGQFVYDDLLMIERNPLIRDLANLSAIFGGSYWDFLDPATAQRIGYWRPLATTALAVGHAIGGGTPFAFHALSLLAHVVATLLAFRLAARYTESERVGFWAALLFGLHPVHVESVSWITAINDPLFGLFALASLGSFVRWRSLGSVGLPVGAAVALAFALLSKELAIAAVPAALVLDLGLRRAPGARPLRPFLRPYGTFAAVVALYYVARILVFGDLRAGFDRTTTEFGVSVGRLLLLRIEMLGGFIGLAAWPAELNLFRPFRPEPDGGALLAAGLWIGVTAVAAVGLAQAARRPGGDLRRRALGALLFLPVCVMPALIRVQSIGTFPISDRFLYLAVFGATLLAALVVSRALPPLPAALVLGAAAVALGTRTWTRQDAWKDEEALFTTAVMQSPDSPNTHWGIGRVLLQRYRDDGDPRVLVLAREAFGRAQDLCEAALEGDQTVFATSDDTLQSNLGLAWCLIYWARTDPFHDFETPRLLLEQLARSYPDNERVLTAQGTVLAELGRNDEAEQAFLEALRLNDKFAVAHFNLGYLYRRMDAWERALPHFELNVALRAEHLDGLVWLAWARAETGRPDLARETARRALEVHPEAAEPMLVLGTLDAREEKREDALRWFERAARADPTHAGAQLERARALSDLGRTGEAAIAASRAAELAPTSFEAHYLTGALLSELGRPELALTSAIRAYELRSPDERGRLLHDRLSVLAAEDAELAVHLADVEYRAGRLPGVIEWTGLALAIHPDDGEALFLRGSALARTGRADAGVEDLRRAARALPDVHEVHLELGQVLVGLELPAEALVHLERALELPSRVQRNPELERARRDALQAEIRRLREPGAPGSDD